MPILISGGATITYRALERLYSYTKLLQIVIPYILQQYTPLRRKFLSQWSKRQGWGWGSSPPRDIGQSAEFLGFGFHVLLTTPLPSPIRPPSVRITTVQSNPVKESAQKMSFEPKTKVELDPPKDDIISLDYLSKCDGELHAAHTAQQHPVLDVSDQSQAPTLTILPTSLSRVLSSM